MIMRSPNLSTALMVVLDLFPHHPHQAPFNEPLESPWDHPINNVSLSYFRCYSISCWYGEEDPFWFNGEGFQHLHGFHDQVSHSHTTFFFSFSFYFFFVMHIWILHFIVRNQWLHLVFWCPSMDAEYKILKSLLSNSLSIWSNLYSRMILEQEVLSSNTTELLVSFNFLSFNLSLRLRSFRKS